MGNERALSILAGVPDIELESQFYWNSFWDLDTCRETSMSLGKIPFTAITDYTRFYSFTSEEAYLFAEIIRRVDARYVRLHCDKAEEKKRATNR